MNDYLALSVASKRFEKVRKVAASMSIELTEEDFPVVKEMNKEARLDQAIKSIAVFSEIAFMRPLSQAELNALKELTLDEVGAFQIALCGAADKNEFITQSLSGRLTHTV